MVGITKSSTRLSTIVPNYQSLVNGNQSNTRTIEQRNESRKQHKRQLVAGVLGEKRRKNKPRGVGEQMAHWPRVRLTTLLAARPFLLASSQPNPRTSRERNCGRQSPSCQTERRNEVEKVFRKKTAKGEGRNVPWSRYLGKLNSAREIERGNSTRFVAALLPRGFEFYFLPRSWFALCRLTLLFAIYRGLRKQFGTRFVGVKKEMCWCFG